MSSCPTEIQSHRATRSGTLLSGTLLSGTLLTGTLLSGTLLSGNKQSRTQQSNIRLPPHTAPRSTTAPDARHQPRSTPG